jgi:hypothetical protein
VVTEVPAWQPAVGLLGLALTAYLFVLIAAHFFRAETLLSTSPLRWPLAFRLHHQDTKNTKD